MIAKLHIKGVRENLMPTLLYTYSKFQYMCNILEVMAIY